MMLNHHLDFSTLADTFESQVINNRERLMVCRLSASHWR
jgi:hypothetical protein